LFIVSADRQVGVLVNFAIMFPNSMPRTLRNRVGHELPERWSAGACSERRAWAIGAVYGASNAPYKSVASGGDGAFVAAAALCIDAVSIPECWCRKSHYFVFLS
jgi:hypothetical protein